MDFVLFRRNGMNVEWSWTASRGVGCLTDGCDETNPSSPKSMTVTRRKKVSKLMTNRDTY